MAGRGGRGTADEELIPGGGGQGQGHRLPSEPSGQLPGPRGHLVAFRAIRRAGRHRHQDDTEADAHGSVDRRGAERRRLDDRRRSVGLDQDRGQGPPGSAAQDKPGQGFHGGADSEPDRSFSSDGEQPEFDPAPAPREQR